MRLLHSLLLNKAEQNTPKTIPLTFTNTGENSATVKLTKTGSPTVDGIQYRFGTSGGWNTYTIDTVLTLTNVGDVVQFQNTNEQLSLSTSNYVNVKCTGKVAASGNLMSMLNYSNTVTSFAFIKLFQGCSTLTSAPDLLADTVEENGCENLFDGTSALRNPPLMTATTIGKKGYISVFWNSGLYEAPELPATTIGEEAYRNMFYGCTSLVKAPTILPATSLVKACYAYMFYGCSSLKTAPELPSKNLANNCYENMFYGCSSLKTAPELPATSLKDYCYSHMFHNCTALISAPDLPSTWAKANCYYYMFNYCSSLVTPPTIKLDRCESSCCGYMFSGCYALKTPPVLSATTLASSCYRGMFRDCNNLESAPVLSATTLSNYCYCEMFYGCSSLKTAPVLPAKNLPAYCYREMFRNCNNLETAPELPAFELPSYGYDCYDNIFNGCTKLKYIKVKFTSWTGGTTDNWVAGVSPTGEFDAPSTLPVIFGDSNIPTGWTLTNVSPFIQAEDQSTEFSTIFEKSFTIKYFVYPLDSIMTFALAENTSLPAGLELNTSTGEIKGISTASEGVYETNIKISAPDCEDVTILLTITISSSTALTTPHNLTSNTSDERYEVSQSTNLESKRHAWNAMDGSLDEETGCSHTRQSSNSWWKIKFNEGPVMVTKLTWTNRTTGIGTYLKNPYKIQASNDDSQWTDILTINDMTNVSEAVHTWEVNSTEKYQYWRILQTGYSYLIIGEIEFEYTL